MGLGFGFLEPFGEVVDGVAVVGGFEGGIFVADFGEGAGFAVWNEKEVVPAAVFAAGGFCDFTGAAAFENNWLAAWFAVGEAVFDAGFAVGFVFEELEEFFDADLFVEVRVVGAWQTAEGFDVEAGVGFDAGLV